MVIRYGGAFGLAVGAAAFAQAPQPEFGPRLERFTYPWPVQTMAMDVVGEPAEIAFMDIAPVRPNGRAVVLLHGKNFCGPVWTSSARALADAGYRVLIPDHLGFCKSSKPRSAQYSFALLASTTRRLMEARGLPRATVVGHSMGGMLAMRFAIAHPRAVERLVLVNPLGLRDRSEEGVPYADVDTLWAQEKKTSFDTLKTYQQQHYYHGTWKPSYDRWVWLQAGMYRGVGRDQVALAQAKASEMIYTQPVAHQLERITPPTTLIVGTLDTVVFGRQRAPASLQAFLKAAPQIAPEAVRRMPNATLVRMEGLGHVPQVEDPARFERTLLGILGANPKTGTPPRP
jgi:pimeloyl-ACP methyl ester carboxylesterase